MADELTEQSERLKQIGAVLTEAFARAGWVDRNLGGAEAFARAMRRLEQSAHSLARVGWIIPMSMTAAEINKIVIAKTKSQIDASFVKLFEANRRRHFNRTIREMLARKELKPSHRLIRQAAAAYRRRHYAITVPALLTVIEGAIMRGRRETKFLKVTGQHVQRLEVDKPQAFELVLWRIVQNYLVRLFGSKDFGGPDPSTLNRNWVAHGRAAADWTQADSLRLFQATDTVSSLIERPRYLP